MKSPDKSLCYRISNVFTAKSENVTNLFERKKDEYRLNERVNKTDNQENNKEMYG